DDKYNNRLDTTATNAGPLTIVFTLAASCATPRTVANYGYLYLLPGCEGLYGGECCPKGWKYNAYFNLGCCLTSYKTYILPIGAQRAETIVYCCLELKLPRKIIQRNLHDNIRGCNTFHTAQDLRFTASPIQIRFKPTQSTIVPVPTNALRLPRRFLYTREKIGIGIGVPVAVALLTIGGG
ncbi:hypothetical protein N7499_004618, partial [Penicillium canescens]